MKWVLEHDEWDDDCSCIIFGDQDYADNTHRNSLNPKHAIKILLNRPFKILLHNAILSNRPFKTFYYDLVN